MPIAADVVLVVGSNIRMEAPLIATRLRRNANNGVSKVFNLGPAVDFNFNHTELGNNPAAILADLVAGKGDVAAALKSAKRPLVVVGMSALSGSSGEAVSAALSKLSGVLPNLRTADWDGLAYLHTAAGRVAAQDLGFVPGPNAFAKRKSLDTSIFSWSVTLESHVYRSGAHLLKYSLYFLMCVLLFFTCFSYYFQPLAWSSY